MSDKLSPMQEQLLSQASNILQAVSDSVGKAADFTVDAATKAGNFAATQIPDIAYQYIAYGRASTTAAFIFGVLGVILLTWIIVAVCFNNKYNIKDTEARGFIAFLSSAFIGIPSFGFVFVHFNDMIMVWFAPKVWLIREIVHLVK